MTEKIKAATLTANDLVNATEVASVEPTNMNGMKQETMSENVTYFTSDELGRLGKESNLLPLKPVLMVKR